MTRPGPLWLAGLTAVVLLTVMVITQPWSSDDRLSVEIAAPRRVNEGELVEMQAVALGDGDLRYIWRQTDGPRVRLSGVGTANASFRAPRGIATSDLSFSVTVTHGQNSNNDVVHVAVQPSKDHEKLEKGSVQQLFKTGLGKTVEDWFGKTGPGTWGTADDDSGATGFCSKGVTQRSHYLPRGNWELAGALHGIERWTEDGTGNFKRAGLRLEFSCGNSIELALHQASGGEANPSGTYHPRLRHIPNDADPIELGAKNPVSLELEQVLSFKLTWNHGLLTAAWKQSPATGTWTEVRIDPSTWPSPYPPSILTIFVDRGYACFRDLALTGM